MPIRASILLVDDAEDTLDVLGRHLHSRGHEVTTATGAREALARLDRARFDLVITDIRMPDVSGMELLRVVRERFTDTEVVLITGYATIQGAVEAVKTGATEYLAKPFTKDELLAAVERALEKLAASRKAREAPPPASRFGLVGRSAVWCATLDLLEAAAQDSRPVILLGERGTGRRTAALAVASSLSEAPVLIASCGRLAPGAGLADRARAAKRGSLLVLDLDEAAAAQLSDLMEIATSAPPRLLLIASSHLPASVNAGRFPKDLWDASTRVVLPPLRDREGDARLLAAHFARAGDPGPALAWSEEAMQALEAYPWPGNIAELEESVLLLRGTHAGGRTVELRDLPEAVRTHYAQAGRSLEEVESEHIRRVLARVGGNRSRAAEILGINRKTLGEKLKVMEPAGGDPPMGP